MLRSLSGGSRDRPADRPCLPFTWTGVDCYYYQATDIFGPVFDPTIAGIRAFSSTPLLIAEISAKID